MKNLTLMTNVPLKDITENLYKQKLLDLDKVIKLKGLLLTNQFLTFTLTLNTYGFTLKHLNGNFIDYNEKSIVDVIQKEKYV